MVSKYYLTPAGEREIRIRGGSDLGQVLIIFEGPPGDEGGTIQDVIVCCNETVAAVAANRKAWAEAAAQHKRILDDPYRYLVEALARGFLTDTP